MMRSLFSGVSGLKVHQTSMDVIGNNIANVNTIGFKSSKANFADVFYQNLQNASGPNPNTGASGVNAKQIGLGTTLAAINVNVTGIGGTQRTDRALDLMLNGDAFFIVESAGQTYFTKAGAMNVDPNGNLYNTSNNANVLGWQADANGNIIKDTVSALKITSPERMFTPPEATTLITLSGNIDPNGTDVAFDGDATTPGYIVPMNFYDRLGNSYTLKMGLEQESSIVTNQYDLTLIDIVDTDDESIFSVKTTTTTGTPPVTTTTYAINPLFTSGITVAGVTYAVAVDASTGEVTITQPIPKPKLTFDGASGAFLGVSDTPTTQGNTINVDLNAGTPATPAANNPFPMEGLEIDFSALTMYSQSGISKVEPFRGESGTGLRGGYAAGKLDGFSIAQDGRIYGIYSNGVTKCFGQIAVATFANPSGLEAVGNSLFRTTLNSGDFDGVGVEPSTQGGISTGALEMSNVDLATEFTNMITTQRGFQANSRIITTSDSMLEELISLKR